jgi:ketosteroid isomerase-like protein
MTLEPLQIAVRFLDPDVAVVHWSWTGTGDRNPDGTARQRRYGMMTMVAVKRTGSWRVVAAQNDNSLPGLPPEFEGITSPMPIPDQVGAQPSN